MKKLIYLTFILLLFQLPGKSQTAIIDENFLDPLVGWNMEGNWTQEEGYMLLYYYPIVENYDFSSYTPEFDVPENGGDVIITQFIDVYMANATDEICEISVVHEDGETLMFSQNLADGAWGDISGTELLIPLDNFIGQTVQLKFSSRGAATNALWGWFIFNVNLTTFFNHELCALNIMGPGNINPMETGTWQLGIQNMGLSTEENFDVKLYSFKEGQELASATFSGALSPGETSSVEFEWYSDIVQNTVLYAEIESASDEFIHNNKSIGHFLRVEPDFPYTVLLWDNDNGIETVVQPETDLLQQPHEGISKALQNAGINFDYATSLPENLEEYNIVISTMGCYCLS